MKHVLMPEFGFTDFWYRYEWQARGSGHIHMMAWIPHANGAPPIGKTDECCAGVKRSPQNILTPLAFIRALLMLPEKCLP